MTFSSSKNISIVFFINAMYDLYKRISSRFNIASECGVKRSMSKDFIKMYFIFLKLVESIIWKDWKKIPSFSVCHIKTKQRWNMFPHKYPWINTHCQWFAAGQPRGCQYQTRSSSVTQTQSLHASLAAPVGGCSSWSFPCTNNGLNLKNVVIWDYVPQGAGVYTHY